jgi:hypothetical protein
MFLELLIVALDLPSLALATLTLALSHRERA